ncbi:hypothetical protein [Microbacterium sp. NPDC056569]|uniref:hypothetical protein n=1 Tax=Microbacterium sp. NPDC056569 TaxID=3345867 RepID=UPI0036727ACC
MTAPRTQDQRADDRPRRRRLVALAGLVLVAAAVAVAVYLGTPPSAPAPPTPAGALDAADTGENQPPPDTGEDQPSTEPLGIEAPPTAPLSPSQDDEVERAEATADAVVSATNEIAQRGDGSAVGLDQIATGFVLGELEAAAQQQYDLGYHQVGEAEVTQTTASDVDLSADPPTMTLTVCVDVSGIDVLDETGKSLKASLYNPGRPVKHVYGAVFEDDVWKLATHEIPDDQDCPLP